MNDDKKPDPRPWPDAMDDWIKRGFTREREALEKMEMLLRRYREALEEIKNLKSGNPTLSGVMREIADAALSGRQEPE